MGAFRDILGGMSAISVKELRGRMRGKRAFVIITIHLLLVAGFAWMVETLMERTLTSGFGGTFSASAEIGRALFVAMLILLTLIVLVLAPASTAGAISLEREKQTLDLLITTPISSLAIVLGKLLSALSWILLLLLASIPVTALVFTFGGVGPDDMVKGYVVLLVTALFYGSVGLFVSALVKRTQAATVINLVTVIALTAGTGFIFIFWSTMTNQGFPARRRRPRRRVCRVAGPTAARGAPVVQPVHRAAGRRMRYRDRLWLVVPDHQRHHEQPGGLQQRQPRERLRGPARQLLAARRVRDGGDVADPHRRVRPAGLAHATLANQATSRSAATCTR